MTTATVSESLRCLARSRVYAYLTAWFRYPTRESWDALAQEDNRASFAEACDVLLQDEAYAALGRRRSGFPADGCVSLEDLEDLCQSVFGHTISKEFPPYETEYGQMHLFQQTDFLADLAGFYRAFGVEVKERVERVDHISTELEFLYLLTLKEGHALERGQTEQAGICRDAQVSFLEAHLGRWAVVFAQQVERKHPENAYGAAAGLLFDFIGAEGVALNIQADSVPDFSRGESLPAGSNEWDSADWMQGETPCAETNERAEPCP